MEKDRGNRNMHERQTNHRVTENTEITIERKREKSKFDSFRNPIIYSLIARCLSFSVSSVTLWLDCLFICRCKSPPHGVLRDRPRHHELQQVIRPARLGADARQLEAAERLAVHQRPRDLAVDVEIADAELAFAPARCSPGCASRGRRSARTACRWRSPGPRPDRGPSCTASTGPKISSWASAAVGGTSAKMCGAT